MPNLTCMNERAHPSLKHVRLIKVNLVVVLLAHGSRQAQNPPPDEHAAVPTVYTIHLVEQDVWA